MNKFLIWTIALLSIAAISSVIYFSFYLPMSDESNQGQVPQEDVDNSDNSITNDDREVSRSGEVSELVVVNSPTTNQTVSSPIKISGEAPGYWFFEATAPVSVVNWDGLIIGEGYIQADGEWMTEELVDFSGQVSYVLPANQYSLDGWVILMRSNASGLPENDAAVEIPVKLSIN